MKQIPPSTDYMRAVIGGLVRYDKETARAICDEHHVKLTGKKLTDEQFEMIYVTVLKRKKRLL